MTNTEQNNNYLEAQKRVKKIKGFYVHIVFFVVANLFLFILPFILNKQNNLNINIVYWTFSNVGFWGLGLLIHGLSVFAPIFFFGKEWEERKIKELIEKEKQQKWS